MENLCDPEIAHRDLEPSTGGLRSTETHSFRKRWGSGGTLPSRVHGEATRRGPFAGLLIRALLILLAGALIPAHASGGTREVWISAQTNALGTGRIWGTGAITNPFCGDFDAILNSLPSHTAIHLLPGVFYTKGFEWAHGDPSLKAYQKVIGAGMDVTILRRVVRFHPDDAQMDGLLCSRGDGVEISDMTLDVNANGTEKYKRAAINLRGSHCAVRRVRAIHTAGNWGRGQESFPICVGWTDTVGNVISDCEVSAVRGTYCTAITLQGQGVVKFNRVFFPILNQFAPGFTGYQINAGRNTLLLGNVCEGGASGFHTDTFSETNLTLLNNWFHNVEYGISIIKAKHWNVDGVAIRNNVIELNANVGRMGIVVRNADRSGKVVYQNVTVAGNTIRCAARHVHPQATAIEISAAAETNFVNVRILHNTVDRSFRFRLQASGVLLANNTDLEGVPLDVRHVRDRGSGTVALGPMDGRVFVTASNTASVILPAARGFSGKTVTIANEKAGGRLTIKAAAGERLLPSDPERLPAGQAAKFISDGLKFWIRE